MKVFLPKHMITEEKRPKRRTTPRKHFHVLVYSTDDKVIVDWHSNARNPSQAAADGAAKAHLNYQIGRVTVDGVDYWPFPEGGTGIKKKGTANFWCRVAVPELRSLRTFIPEGWYSQFVTDALAAKLEAEMHELEAGTSKYQLAELEARKPFGSRDGPKRRDGNWKMEEGQV